MRICLISDTHLGLTKYECLEKMYNEIAEQDFDVLVHAGDYVGSTRGYKTIRSSIRQIRRIFPNKPFISTLGNHHIYYLRSQKHQHTHCKDFFHNQQRIQEILAENNVHFLDKDGIFQFENVLICGAMGWYHHPNPPTNCINYIPPYLGHTHMSKETTKDLYRNLDSLREVYEPHHTVVFVSHLPVIRGEEDPGFDRFAWDPKIGELMQEEFVCRYFLEGHTHRREEGPLKYNCGSDYFNPKYLMVDV